ncbi:Tectonin beta-propeller repeat-containing protein 1 [Halocaridina rubra]|uniref:Tectonin beta-propeller repeat-containing protein 1 n=1 Tax=Halocaridina rubra TaxID=373956 RepID=A0AAN8ZTF1_HALRR
MSDVRHVYVWENQRWNPLTGFTYRGLPTDRYTWSDQTGRHHCTRESAKLPSRHWVWSSEWCVDHHTPGGVDSEGWQYATDFPSSYHPYRYVTDLVRRRRWVRKCRTSTSGPWQQMGKIALIHISVSVSNFHLVKPINESL